MDMRLRKQTRTMLCYAKPVQGWFVVVQLLAAEIQAAGGIVTAQDLAQAQPSIKQPVTSKVSYSFCLSSLIHHTLLSCFTVGTICSQQAAG